MHLSPSYIAVVYRTIPTSNHNYRGYLNLVEQVVYRTIPTSNHNCVCSSTLQGGLYIVLFLHQTTTRAAEEGYQSSCISYYSYIKPQPHGGSFPPAPCCISYYSYIKPQRIVDIIVIGVVVYRTIPTSNHNL